MAQPRKSGRSDAPHEGWESLCSDVRELVLEKLSVCDLARAATVCQAFRGAFVNRVAEARASLIAAGEKAYGKVVFLTFVKALGRIILGSSPFPHLVGENSGVILFTTAEEPRFAPEEEVEKMLISDEPCGIFLLPDIAILHQSCGGTWDKGVTIYFKNYRAIANTLRLDVWMDAEPAALTLGPLVAACMETPLELPPSCPRPTVINFNLWGNPCGTPRIEEAEDFWAPLTSLVESVTTSW